MPVSPSLGASNSGNTNSPTVTVPAGLADGSVFLLHLDQNNTDVLTGTPANLTLVDSINTTASFPNKLYRGVVGSGAGQIAAGTALAFTLSATRQWSLDLFGYTGVDTASPVASTVPASGNSNATSTPAITPTADAYVVGVMVGKSNGTTITTWTAPAGWTNRQTAAAAGTFGGSTVISDFGAVTGGTAVAAAAFTASSAAGAFAAWSVALTPAAGGGGGTITKVKETPGSGASAANQAVAFTNTAGNALLLLYARSGGLSTGSVTSITDANNAGWVLVTRGAVSGTSNTRIEAWLCPNAAATTGITVNSGSAQTNAWTVLEFSGVVSASPVDVSSPDNSATASGGSITTPAINTTNAVDAIVAACHFGQTTATAPGAPWSAVGNFDDGAVGSGRAVWQLVTATGSYSATWTALGSNKAAGVITLALKAAASTSTTKTLGGSVTATGQRPPRRVVTKPVTGAVTGAGTKLLTLGRILAGAAQPSGTKTGRLGRALGGSASASGTILRSQPRVLAGSLAAAGTLGRAVGKALAGSSTATGTKLSLLGRPLSGGTTPAGTAVKLPRRTLGGSSTPAAVTLAFAARFRSFAGSVTAIGVKVASAGKATTGTATPTGTKLAVVGHQAAGATAPTGTAARLVRKVLGGSSTPAAVTLAFAARFRSFAGSVTAAGVKLVTAGKAPSGSAAASGTVRRSPAATRGGTTTPTGSAVKVGRRITAGTAAPTGSVIGLAQRIKALAGAASSTGVVRRRPQKAPAGGLQPSGSPLRRAIRKLPGGVVAAIGQLLSGANIRIYGRAGTAELTLGPAVETEIEFYLRHRAQMDVVEVGDVQIEGLVAAWTP